MQKLSLSLLCVLTLIGCSETEKEHLEQGGRAPVSGDQVKGQDAEGSTFDIEGRESLSHDANSEATGQGEDAGPLIQDDALDAGLRSEGEDSTLAPSQGEADIGPDTSDDADMEDIQGSDALDATGDASQAEDADMASEESAVEPLSDSSEALDVSDILADSDSAASDASNEVNEVEEGEDTAPSEAFDASDALDAEATEEGDSNLSEDIEGEDIGEPPSPPAPLFLLSINNTTDTLEKIDVLTGAGTDLCQLESISSYPSLTFSRDNVLFASRGGTALDIIDPCTCQVTAVASYGGYGGVNGITSDQGLNLFGVASNQDEFISISTSAGVAEGIGPLGVDFGAAGATWSEEDQSVYAINATTDGLYDIDPLTGSATLIAPLSQPMGTVGIEMHPANGVLYACSSEAILLEIDTLSGQVTEIGHTGQEGSCTNLAAPWKTVPCLQ